MNTLRILLVEDDDVLRRTLKVGLEADGHAVIAAANGAFGTRLLENFRFDLVVTDIVASRAGESEMARALRRTPFAPPIIAMSGGGTNGLADYLVVASHLGARETLVKPFAISELLAAIARAVPPE